jgi:hypothetical protein
MAMCQDWNAGLLEPLLDQPTEGATQVGPCALRDLPKNIYVIHVSIYHVLYEYQTICGSCFSIAHLS